MYLEYFSLSKPPFRITPDTHVFFEGSDRGPTLNALIFAIQNGEGIVKVVCEVGTDENLSSRKIRQLRERITQGLYLSPLTLHDIHASGYRGHDLFSLEVAATIEKYSHGLIRRINILADKTLLTAYAQNSYNLTVRDIKLAAEDSQYTPRKRRWPWNEAIAGALFCLGLLFSVEQFDSLSLIYSQQIADTILYDQ